MKTSFLYKSGAPNPSINIFIESSFLGQLMMQEIDFFRSRIDAMINLTDPLAVLATRLAWNQIETAVALATRVSRSQVTVRGLIKRLGSLFSTMRVFDKKQSTP